jgi:hypothetical protein
MLRLALEGLVLRTRGNLVVVSIERPEFRTAGKNTAVPCVDVAPLAIGLEKISATERQNNANRFMTGLNDQRRAPL